MRAKIEQRIETTWGNQLAIDVEAELDNDSSMTTREVATLMVLTMKTLVEEVRSENERVSLRAGEDGGTIEHHRLAEVQHDISDPRKDREEVK